MRIPKFTRFVVAALVVATFAVNASAQATATGKVTLKQADGTEVPVQGAQVEFHRTDIKQTLKTKTDKKGQYVYAGLDYVGTFTIIVSAPGASPTYVAGVRISQRPENNFVLLPGDGRTLTLAEIKAAGAGGAAQPGAAAGAAAPPPISAEEAKKKQAEIAAIEAKNAKVIERNEKLPVVFKAGNDAVNAARTLKGAERIAKLDEAITAYNQGIEIDPEEAVVYSNKQIALRMRGVEKYNMAATSRDKAARQSGMESAREDLKNAVEAGEKAVAAHRQSKSTQSGGEVSGATGNTELQFLADRAESYRLALQIKATIDNDVAVKSIEEYINAETDTAKKDKMQASLGDALFFAGRVPEAVAKFKEITTKNPNNFDAVYGLGVALAASDPPQLAEARDMLQQYVSKAPESPRKQEAMEMVKYLDDTIQAETANKAQETREKGRTGGRRRP